ncbi:hypothetical protein [Litoreibacter janthinus]|uniref:Alkaline phosphatase n=1 Tax=Litoreibacter janthinus TaxID=670154 RepID=A0A1I6HY01_9RHOB|nr:hypothetical protein [Litoreibacter janthinus]SFR59346.1 hypothetical protein SAMN04488002_3574 [Litoreibacter janthinus]
MSNPFNTSAMNVVAAVLALTSTTLTFADEMLIIDPNSGEAVFFTESASEAYSQGLRNDDGGASATKGYRTQIYDLASDLPEGGAGVLVVDPITGEVVSLTDIDVSSLSDDDRRFIGDQLFFQGIGPNHASQGDLIFN